MQDVLIKLFAEELGLDASFLDENSCPENTDEWDSLAAMNLVAAIEEAFDVTLTTSEIMMMNSIGAARNVLVQKGVSV